MNLETHWSESPFCSVFQNWHAFCNSPAIPPKLGWIAQGVIKMAANLSSLNRAIASVFGALLLASVFVGSAVAPAEVSIERIAI